MVPTRNSGLVVPPFAANLLSYPLDYRGPLYPLLSIVIIEPFGLLLCIANSIKSNFKCQNISCRRKLWILGYLTCHPRIIIALFVWWGYGPENQLLLERPLLLGAHITWYVAPTRTLSHEFRWIWILKIVLLNKWAPYTSLHFMFFNRFLSVCNYSDMSFFVY